MMKHVLLAGVIALGAIGIAGSAMANGPCQALGPYSVCLLHQDGYSYNYGYSGDCYNYQAQGGATTTTLASATGSGPGAAVRQTKGSDSSSYHEDCTFSGFVTGFYQYDSSSSSAYKNTNAGASYGAPFGFVAINGYQYIGSYQSSDSYNYNEDLGGFLQESGQGSDASSGANHDTGASAQFNNPSPVSPNAGVNQNDDKSSYESHSTSCAFGCSSYDYSSSSSNKDTTFYANAGPVSVNGGQRDDAYSYSNTFGSGSGSLKEDGVYVNSPAGSLFTGERSVNGGACQAFVGGRAVGPCPGAMPADVPDVPEVPDFPAPL
jgi:hypothetical protein